MTRNVKLTTLLQPADCLSIRPTNSTIRKPLSPLGGGLGEHFATPCFGRTQLSRKWCCFSSSSSLYLSRFFTSNYLKRDSRDESSDCVSLGMSETEAQETTTSMVDLFFHIILAQFRLLSTCLGGGQEVMYYLCIEQ